MDAMAGAEVPTLGRGAYLGSANADFVTVQHVVALVDRRAHI